MTRSVPPIVADHRKPSPLQVLSFITVCIAWGTTYGGIKVAVQHIPPFALASIRFLVAGVAMLLAFRAWGIPFPGRRDWPRIALVGFLLLSLSNSMLGYAEQHVSSIFASLMVNIAPFVYVGLAAWGGERIPRAAWGGLMLGVVGILTLVLVKRGSGAMDSGAIPGSLEFWLAIVALVVGPICWSGGSFIANRFPPKSHPLMIAAGQTFCGGLGAGIISLLIQEHPAARVAAAPAEAWLAMAWLVVVGSWLGYVAYMHCVMTLPAHQTASITYVNMVVAVAVGAIVLGEPLTPGIIVAGTIILAGVYIVNTARQQARKAAT